MIPEAGVNDRESNSLLLDIGVRRAKPANQIGSPDLAPHQVIRMIHDLHLVGLGVSHPELDLARDRA